MTSPTNITETTTATTTDAPLTPGVFTVPAPQPTAWDLHNEFQREIIGDLAVEITEGKEIEPKRIEITLSAKYDNTLIRDFAIKNKIVPSTTLAGLWNGVDLGALFS
jgi:hypothetical protein